MNECQNICNFEFIEEPQPPSKFRFRWVPRTLVLRTSDFASFDVGSQSHHSAKVFGQFGRGSSMLCVAQRF